LSSLVLSGTVVGVDGVPVSVEVDLVRRLPRVTIVGLPASAVRESTERVRSAILSTGLDFPRMCVTVNLAPGDLRKDGTGLDLPIALAILAASDQIPKAPLNSCIFAGELSLNGSLRGIRGGLSLAMLAAEKGVSKIVLPEGCAGEAAMVPGVTVCAANTLSDVVRFIRGEQELPAALASAQSEEEGTVDMADVRGQDLARRALEISAAGGHNLLMVGPPGVGKTMLAARLPTIMPRMSFEETLDVTRVHSVAGLLPTFGGVVERRPFRAPHHTISAAGLLGGARLQPGEVTLAHRGVLFLDEFPEFSRGLLEQLRGPLEDRVVVLSRAAGTVQFPAACMLVAAANPCPCGFLGHPVVPCRCTESMLRRYSSRLSGPLLDRIDLYVSVDPIETETLFRRSKSESSKSVRLRVERARKLQFKRFTGSTVTCNAELHAGNVREVANATVPAVRALKRAVESMSISGRGHDRILKIGRTIADLDGSRDVQLSHIAEAIAYRPRNSGFRGES